MSPKSNDFFQRARFHTTLDAVKQELRLAEAELAERKGEILAFEAQVEARLGEQLDELNYLEGEVARYLDLVEKLRRGWDWERKTKPKVESSHHSDHKNSKRNVESEGEMQARLRSLYRKLVRRYHPDLAIDDPDRARRTEWMMALNRAYAAGDLEAMCSLDAGVPDVDTWRKSPKPKTSSTTKITAEEELALAHQRLEEVRNELDNLHRHPSVQLSLDVKLAERQGRDLLAEISQELGEKIERKRVECDFLRIQLAQAGIKV